MRRRILVSMLWSYRNITIDCSRYVWCNQEAVTKFRIRNLFRIQYPIIKIICHIHPSNNIIYWKIQMETYLHVDYAG